MDEIILRVVMMGVCLFVSVTTLIFAVIGNYEESPEYLKVSALFVIAAMLAMWLH